MPSFITSCPFCLPAAGQVAFTGPLTKAIWDAFPVTEGHLLLTPHRHVAIWSELHDSEQAALIGAIETAQTLLNERHAPDGFNVGFNQGVAAGQTIDHFHIHVIPRRAGDVADPRGGVRHVIPAKGNYLAGAEQGNGGGLTGRQGSPSSSHAFGAGPSFSLWEKGSAPHARALIAGGEDALIRHLTPHIDEADRVDIAVSFVMGSGVRLLRPHLQDLLDRGAFLRPPALLRLENSRASRLFAVQVCAFE